MYEFTNYVNYSIEKENHSFEETKEILDKLLKIPRKKVKEIADNDNTIDSGILFTFDYLIKWLELLVKYKVGFAASY